jgi:transposase
VRNTLPFLSDEGAIVPLDVVSNFPEECRYVLENLAEVSGYDAQAEERGLSPEERLRFHQEHRGPVMEKLRAGLRGQLVEKKVEPNSDLGSAIQYSLKHWKELTFSASSRGPLKPVNW